MSLFDRLFKSNIIDLQEFTTGNRIEIDRDNGILRNVKILGSDSNNNRIYLFDALKKAIPLYEGMKVNVNHGDMPGSRRDLEDRMGVLRNVKVQEDGLFADFHFNPKHRFADQLIWNAEHDPNNIGFSHDATCRHTRRNGVMIIEEIQVVKCVDLVGQPATTVGLFESESKTMRKTVIEIAKAAKHRQLIKLCEADDGLGEVPIGEVPVEVPNEATADDAVLTAFIAAVNDVMRDKTLDLATMKKKIDAILKAKAQMDDATGNTDQALEQDVETISAPNGEGKGGTKPDGKGDPGPVQEVQKMREQLERLERKDSVRSLLAKTGASVSDDIFEMLCELPSNKSRETMLANLGTPKRGGERPHSTGTSKLQEALNFGNESDVKDGESFAKAICH